VGGWRRDGGLGEAAVQAIAIRTVAQFAPAFDENNKMEARPLICEGVSVSIWLFQGLENGSSVVHVGRLKKRKKSKKPKAPKRPPQPGANQIAFRVVSESIRDK
jgi:hypothetical protein